MKKIIAIIPDRQGSKRIPKKNIKNFNGKPIILNTIEKLKKSKLFDKIIISTDSKQIVKICEKKGVEAPFLRSKNLSGDKVTTNAVIQHSINFLEKKNYDFNFVCCVYAPNPFLQSKDLIAGYKKVQNSRYTFVFSGTNFLYPYSRSFIINKKQKLELIFPENKLKKTQNIKTLTCDAAQFYWGHKKNWLKYNHVFQKNSSIITIPNYRYCDIDTLEDWKRAEVIGKIV